MTIMLVWPGVLMLSLLLMGLTDQAPYPLPPARVGDPGLACSDGSRRDMYYGDFNDARTGDIVEFDGRPQRVELIVGLNPEVVMLEGHENPVSMLELRLLERGPVN